MSASRLHQLSTLGQSVWIDFLSRELLESGALAHAPLKSDAVVGVTSNPTIFAKALRPARRTTSRSLPATATRRASSSSWRCATSRTPAICFAGLGADRGWGRLRLDEVDPNLAGDTEATIAQATYFHETISRPNLLVKIPATESGVPAIEEMTARGYSINVTLIFSLTVTARSPRRTCADSSGFLPPAATQSHPLGRQLLRLPCRHRDRPPTRRTGRDDLKGRLGIANAKLAYQQYKELFAASAGTRSLRAARPRNAACGRRLP